ncbi:MAG: hypothetical protein LBU60_02265 [Clostridiales bacterium]|jgi:hypothetical protein|nr:hypothetical protein [Clostridiales bacterium]
MITKVESNYIQTVEAVMDRGVIYSELDSFRFFDRRSTLFSVPSAGQTQINKAVEWLHLQVQRNRPYWALVSTEHWDSGLNFAWGTDATNCSTLTWGAYYYAGINLTNSAINQTTWVLPMSIRDSSKVSVGRKNVAYKGYQFVNWNSNKSIDLPNMSVGNSKKLQQYETNTSDAQIFIEITTPERFSSPNLYDLHYYSIVDPKYMFDVEQPMWPFDGNANGRKLQIFYTNWDDHASYRSFWWNDNQLMTKNTGYKRSIHVADASFSNGATLHQWDVTGHYTSKWNKNYRYSYYFKFYNW